jgi:hypothetical protein
MPLMRNLSVIALLCLAALAGAAAGPLDGSSFAIQLASDGKAQGADVLAFAGGEADCVAAARKYAYAKAAYQAEKQGKAWSFRFTMTSAEHGDLAFAGRITAEGVTGTRTWSKPGKTPIVHTFTGTPAK